VGTLLAGMQMMRLLIESESKWRSGIALPKVPEAGMALLIILICNLVPTVIAIASHSFGKTSAFASSN